MRLALIVAIAALWNAAPAAAAVPVVGGGSFHDAPVLKPGSYRDTLLPEETLYYAVDLKAGQSLAIDAVIEHDDPDRLTNIYGINMHDPMRSQVRTDDSTENRPTSTVMHVRSPRALTPDLEIDDASWYRQYHGPGRYYFTIVDPGAGDVPVASDVTFELQVLGEPSDLPRPSPTPRPRATPRPADDDDDDGGSPLAAVLVGGGGLLAGALVGFGGVLATRRRRGLG